MKYVIIRIQDSGVNAITSDLAEITKDFGVWDEREAKDAILKLPRQEFIASKKKKVRG